MITLEELRKKIEVCEDDPYEFFTTNKFTDLERACHPDKWIDNAKEASDLFKKFGIQHELSLNLASLDEYRLVRKIGFGDLSDVFLAKRDSDKFIIKQPRAKGIALVKQEFSVCKKISEEKTVYRLFAPKPVEMIKDSIVFEWEDHLISGSSVIEYKDLDSRHIGWMFKRTLVMFLRFLDRQSKMI